MVSSAEQMSVVADDIINFPTGEEPVGTVYIPQTREPVEGFEYRRRKESGYNFIAKVTREHVGDLADVVSTLVGKGYSPATAKALYGHVFLDPDTIKDPALKEVAKYCWAHAREVIRGRKVFSYPKVRSVDGKHRILGESTQVVVNNNDADGVLELVGALEFANLFKEDPERKVPRKNIYNNPASVWLRWHPVKGTLVNSATPHGSLSNGVAILMRTNEVIDADALEKFKELEELERKASDAEEMKKSHEKEKSEEYLRARF